MTRRPSARLPSLAGLTLMVGLAALAGCDDVDELPVWTPADHDHQSDPSPGQQVAAAPPDGSGRPPPPPAPSGGAGHGVDPVVISVWARQCATCHGKTGGGDGPQAKLVDAPNLQDPERQARLSDEDIATVIVNGRGSMPAFDLPADTVDGLVLLIRAMRRSPGR